MKNIIAKILLLTSIMMSATILIKYGNEELFLSSLMFEAVSFFGYFFSYIKEKFISFFLIISSFSLSLLDFYICVSGTANEPLRIHSWVFVLFFIIGATTLSFIAISIPSVWPTEFKRAVKDFIKSVFRK